ncbi:hypothetical protein DFS34DRAFT_624521, partial [Phlyctochytrium arcticum]
IFFSLFPLYFLDCLCLYFQLHFVSRMFPLPYIPHSVFTYYNFAVFCRWMFSISAIYAFLAYTAFPA